jgi:hypothetical protein
MYISSVYNIQFYIYVLNLCFVHFKQTVSFLSHESPFWMKNQDIVSDLAYFKRFVPLKRIFQVWNNKMLDMISFVN